MARNKPQQTTPVPESGIIDGKYQPGRMNHIRLKAADSLFRQRPSVAERVMHGPGAWKWHKTGRLEFSDVVGDGFCARYSKEFLVLDEREDEVLQDFLFRVGAKLQKEKDTTQQVLLVAKEISAAFGGLDPKVGAIWQKRINDLGIPVGDSLHVGKLMRQAGFSGAGMCRHRSLLFKYLMGKLEVAKCAALTGVIVPPDVSNVAKFRKENGFADHAWNIVSIGGTNFLLDIMNTPNELRTANAEGLLLKAGKQSFSYYRIDGGAGISLAVPFEEDDESDTSGSSDRHDTYPAGFDDSDEEMDACCNLTGPAEDLPLQEVYCRSTRRTEPVVHCEPTDSGRFVVEFEIEMGGKCWRARKISSASSRLA